jgi:hypothetical protein
MTTRYHPVEGSEFIQYIYKNTFTSRYQEQEGEPPDMEDQISTITQAVACHMGPWSPEVLTGRWKENEVAMWVFIADYVSSRDFIDINQSVPLEGMRRS